MLVERRKFEFLPLGEILPKGWMQRQLEIQLAGLTGNLDKFWPDVAQSGWIGGSEEGWERGPYWLDGAIPLAYLLQDSQLQVRVERWIDAILKGQHADGWLGPRKGDPATGTVKGSKTERNDPWPVFVVLKGLMQFWEVSGDNRIIPAIDQFLNCLNRLLDENPLDSWAAQRWGECLLSVQWLCEQTGNNSLLSLAQKLQQQGFNWQVLFSDFPYLRRTSFSDRSRAAHVVNNAMAIKYPALWWLISGESADLRTSTHMINTLDRWHGQATGLFTGDEHLAGKNPSQGTELCAVVEYMYSLEHLFSITGKVGFADRLERIAYNALPAAFKPDMWAHQYDQQANQVICKVSEDRIYTSNAGDANIYGLEPHFGCCTANLHQGWPKLVSSLWMRDAEGLVATSYAPCSINTKLGDSQAHLTVDSDYPFKSSINITVNLDQPVEAALRLRIPGWCDHPSILVNNQPLENVHSGTFATIRRRWEGSEKIKLELSTDPVLQRRYHDSVTLTRGPLIYSLKVSDSWKRINHDVQGRELPHGDWEVHPESDWQVALKIGTEALLKTIHFEDKTVGNIPFSPDGAPVVVRARGQKISHWHYEHTAAAPPPQSPVDPETMEGDEVDLTLIPYGCTNLRVTELPWYE